MAFNLGSISYKISTEPLKHALSPFEDPIYSICNFLPNSFNILSCDIMIFSQKKFSLNTWTYFWLKQWAAVMTNLSLIMTFVQIPYSPTSVSKSLESSWNSYFLYSPQSLKLKSEYFMNYSVSQNKPTFWHLSIENLDLVTNFLKS